MTNQTPMKHGRELLRERVADLMLGVNVQEFELVENGAVVAQRLERDVDVLDLGVLARVLDLLDARLVVFEEHDRAGFICCPGQGGTRRRASGARWLCERLHLML